MNDSQRQNSSIEVHTVYFTKPNENEILQDHFQSLLLGFSKETLQNKKPKAAWPLANYKNRDTSIWFTKSKYANCGENLVEKFKYNLFRKPIESSYVLGFFEKDKVIIESFAIK